MATKKQRRDRCLSPLVWGAAGAALGGTLGDPEKFRVDRAALGGLAGALLGHCLQQQREHKHSGGEDEEG